MGQRGAYYNEIDPYAAQWLRNLIAAGHIAPGDVDERSIVDVRPDDLNGYTQCHFFAGIGGWSYAARLAGWPDGRELWTGSCPCQPYSVAGKREGQKDPRHLWPAFFELIRAKSPTVVMGEQVAAAVGKHWLDGVYSDLEGVGYAVRTAVVPACAVDAPHRRDRLWFVADSDVAREGEGRQQRSGELGWTGGYPLNRDVGDASRAGLSIGECEARDASAYRSVPKGEVTADDHPSLAHAASAGRRQAGRDATSNTQALGFWSRNRDGDGSATFVSGADGKARRVEPGICLLAHGVPSRVGKLRALGNAIVPQVAAEVIGAYLDTERLAA